MSEEKAARYREILPEVAKHSSEMERRADEAERETDKLKKCEYMSPQEIENRLKDIGPGSHLIVGINRSSGAGHWFNVYYDGENFHTLDGQSGKTYDWPHDYGNVTQWCAMV